MGGNLESGAPAGQAGKAGSGDRPLHRILGPVEDRAALRRQCRSRGQHLVRRFTNAGSRRPYQQVQPPQPDVGVLSEAAVRRGYAEGSGHARGSDLVLAARQPQHAGDWCPLSGYGQDLDPGRLLSVRASGESVAIADHADREPDGQPVITWRGPTSRSAPTSDRLPGSFGDQSECEITGDTLPSRLSASSGSYSW